MSLKYEVTLLNHHKSRKGMSYYRHGFAHRDDGPAKIQYQRKAKPFAAYYFYGIKYNLDIHTNHFFINLALDEDVQFDIPHAYCINGAYHDDNVFEDEDIEYIDGEYLIKHIAKLPKEQYPKMDLREYDTVEIASDIIESKLYLTIYRTPPTSKNINLDYWRTILDYSGTEFFEWIDIHLQHYTLHKFHLETIEDAGTFVIIN